MAELIPIGTGAAESADITIADGEHVTVFLKKEGGGALPSYVKGIIELKDSAGNYTPIGEITSDDPSVVIAAAGVYRVRKPAYGMAVGVEQAV